MKIEFLTTFTAMLLLRVWAFSAAPETTRYYVTDACEKFYDDVVPISVKQIEASRHEVSSRPADEDPAGHWGPATEGFRLSIRLQKQAFTNGEPVVAMVLLRNVTDQHLTYPVFSDRDLQGAISLSRDGQKLYGHGEAKPGATFLESVAAARRGNSFNWPSPVGTQRRFLVDLTKVFDLTNGHYTASAQRQVPTLRGNGMTNVASGVMEFTIAGAARVGR